MNEIEIKQLVRATGGTLLVAGSRAVTGGVCTDSRKVRPGCVFFALSGDKFDGNSFAADVSRQAAAVVVSKRSGEFDAACSIVRTEDTLAALQSLAKWWRKQLEVVGVVGITGSSGKTSTKDMVRSILEQHYAGRVVATEGNLNNHIGVPMSILNASPATRAAVWEMGMNHAGELAPLCDMVRPTLGIITHIGTAHIGMLGSRDAIAREKCTLARVLPEDGWMIYPEADDYAEMIAGETRARLLPVGGEKCKVRAAEVRCGTEGSDYKLLIDGAGCVDVHLPVPGEHMVSNSLLAAAAAWKLGCSTEEIVAGLMSISLTKGRLTCREEAGRLLVDDTYNANPESMAAALKTVAAMPVTGKHYAVLGKMGELGATGVAAHAEVGRCAAQCGYAGIIVMGEKSAELYAMAREAREGGVHVDAVESPMEAAERLRELTQSGDVILFKGSRAAGIERVMEEFLKKD